jgi:hypothetical protein
MKMLSNSCYLVSIGVSHAGKSQYLYHIIWHKKLKIEYRNTSIQYLIK